MKFSTVFLDSPKNPSPEWIKGLWLFILICLLCAGVMSWAAGLAHGGWSAVWHYHELLLKGWGLTLLISFLSLLMSALIGLSVAMLSRSPIVPLRCLSIFYVEIIRGTPLLVQILFLFYVVANAIGLEDRLLAGILILSIFSGAYLAEMIRSGIESIPASQLESARAIGLTTPQIYRFVIAPQALRHILPALAGQFASLIKDSSLLSIIGLNEFTQAAQQVNSATYCTLQSFLPLALGYLVLTLPISLLSKSLEEHLRYET